MEKLEKYYGNQSTKYRIPLKWSVKVSTNCYEEEQKVAEMRRKLVSMQGSSQSSLNRMAISFEKNAKVDYLKWDCEAMYPHP